jgi:hypothetical protein
MIATNHRSVLPSERPVALVLLLGDGASANERGNGGSGSAPVTRVMLIPSERLLALLSLEAEDTLEVSR